MNLAFEYVGVLCGLGVENLRGGITVGVDEGNFPVGVEVHHLNVVVSERS